MSKLSLNKLRKYRSLMKQGVPTRCGPAILQVPRSWLRRLPETERYSIRECLVKVLRCVRKEKRHHAEVVRGVARRAISIAEISAAWGAVVGASPFGEYVAEKRCGSQSRQAQEAECVRIRVGRNFAERHRRVVQIIPPQSGVVHEAW